MDFYPYFPRVYTCARPRIGYIYKCVPLPSVELFRAYITHELSGRGKSDRSHRTLGYRSGITGLIGWGMDVAQKSVPTPGYVHQSPPMGE